MDRDTSSATPEPVACAQASRETLALARRVATSDCTVLIAGESGTGKEVIARYIHRSSPRAAGAFVAVNCAAIPENMLEAVLFGYEKGAFTGAHAAHAGKFEQAQGGTLLLDEISEMPLALQAKLLRVLQEREVERIGGRGSVALDVRVLATTNRRLRSEVTAARFREDLYYRLNVFPMVLAPLRERRDDILPLAMHLLSMSCAPGQRIPALAADAAQLLLMHGWPGNVRELDNVMQRALILLDGEVIQAEHVRFDMDEGAEPAAPAVSQGQLSSALATAERELILEALRDGHGSRRAAAERLGISPRALRYKLAQLRASGVDLAACG
ncbi:MAG TPA: sigma-54 dependent transcriptional regulator [Steroidobacteraceae bacterium]|nr:sigma-54 dependent transcriptional regulator [Steroidobacteraceae bacterium]HNS28740.1 sigma-54 dependent transcriptional regulator [Steroidobacteraceae bacterium]